ncbi:hypothetical protein IMSHALPRED_009757 [Imshaugia aleurites]|uniref:RING-type domain-containing protein n=1 Tax=Imshaugia aleurites TaxID=172621 RepID=A0A8H3G0R9_9LECA|nr:hypothetical protein IMSHALPRED_009757 [Imshaugia aleurites]
MAEEFLAQLPRVRRGILDHEDQRCPICLEEYGTTPSSRGVIERAVILPCGHIMGSECISIWLSPPANGHGGNNTCPMCRQVLFVAAPRVPRYPLAEHMRIHTVLTNECASACEMLELNRGPDVRRLSRWIANQYHDIVRLDWADGDDRNPHAVAAASVYMASHLLGDARSLEVISRCVTVGEREITRAYILLYIYRRRIVERFPLEMLEGDGAGLGRIDEVLPLIALGRGFY